MYNEHTCANGEKITAVYLIAPKSTKRKLRQMNYADPKVWKRLIKQGRVTKILFDE